MEPTKYDRLGASAARRRRMRGQQRYFRSVILILIFGFATITTVHAYDETAAVHEHTGEKGEEYNDEYIIDGDALEFDEEAFAHEEEAELHKELSQEDESRIEFLPEADGMYRAADSQDLKKILNSHDFYGAPSIVLVLVAHQISCPNSIMLVNKLQSAVQVARDATDAEFQNIGNENDMLSEYLRSPLVVTKIDVEQSSEDFLAQLGIGHTPSLMLLQATREGIEKDKENKTRNIMVFEFPSVPTWTPLDLFLGLHQAVTRLRLNAWSYAMPLFGQKDATHTEIPASMTYTISMVSPDDIGTLWNQFGSQLLSPTPLPPPIDPQMSLREKEAVIRWLSPAEDGSEASLQDPLLVFGQCRQSKSTSDAVYKHFDDLASILFLTRNNLFVVFDSCPETLPDGSVMSFYKDQGSSNLKPWSNWIPGAISDDGDIDNVIKSLTISVLTKATPSLLWLDRQTTAPIAFTNHVQAHVVLFVDTHIVTAPNASLDRLSKWDETTRSTIQELQRACQKHRLEYDEALVCLIVPSTDIRILTTFGIDIWTPYDEGKFGEDADVLPVLMFADQRNGTGLKRYYLKKPLGGIAPFIDRVWNEQEPHVDFRTNHGKYASTGQESGHGSANSHGVLLLSATDFAERIVQNDRKHSLVLLYSPNCAHCKRLHIVWNELSDLVVHLGWDSFVQVGKLDVTENEIFVDGIFAERLPDVYYFAAQAASKPVHFDSVDRFGDGPARIGSPLAFITWLMDVSDLDTAELLEGLEAEATITQE